MTSPPSRDTELLAPAGSIESFFAAMESGADAVYCGLQEFSARAKAKNFTLAEMEKLILYAHKMGRKLYVTANTLIKERELPRVVEILAALASFGVDGLIIQDLGVWRLVRDHFPEIPLHASTQLAVHNSGGVRMLEEMGFGRAVLARELTLEEIAAIRRRTGMELEHFIHGALCFSISGLCLFSSYLTGRSGNRGRCQQPCRRRYTSRGRSGHYFSTSDFEALDQVDRLAQAGVMSFKIEGRMKNAEYVATVVKAYRLVLDAGPGEMKTALARARALLAESYGRRPTPGFLTGRQPKDIVAPEIRAGIGRQLGRLTGVQGTDVFLTPNIPLHVGDRLRIQPESDMTGTSFTVTRMRSGKRPVKRAEKGALVRITTPFKGRFQAGDQVYKVAGGKIFTMSEEACRRRLAPLSPAPMDVALQAGLDDNLLTLEAGTAGITLRREYEVEALPASHSPLSKGTLEQTFGRTGRDNLRLGSLTADELPPVVIRPSRLKEIRRDFYATLSEQVRTRLDGIREERIKRVQATLPARREHIPQETERISVVSGRSRDLALLDHGQADRLILSLTPENVAAVEKQGKGDSCNRDRLVWDLPAIIYEGEWQSYGSVISRLVQRGFLSYRLHNLGHFTLFADFAELTLAAGPWLYVTNSNAALALAELGAGECTLSLEDDRENMADILGRETEIAPAVPIYSPIPLVTSRIPLPFLRRGGVLESGNETMRLDFRSGLSVARAGRDFSLTGHLEELRQSGCTNFIVDLSLTGADSGRGREVLAAVRKDRHLADTSLFNYERGLE